MLGEVVPLLMYHNNFCVDAAYWLDFRTKYPAFRLTSIVTCGIKGSWQGIFVWRGFVFVFLFGLSPL
jgi:hypothetical protein